MKRFQEFVSQQPPLRRLAAIGATRTLGRGSDLAIFPWIRLTPMYARGMQSRLVKQAPPLDERSTNEIKKELPKTLRHEPIHRAAPSRIPFARRYTRIFRPSPYPHRIAAQKRACDHDKGSDGVWTPP
jgi:hypothetical protein